MVGGGLEEARLLLALLVHRTPPPTPATGEKSLLLPGKLLVHRHACANGTTRPLPPGAHSPLPGGWVGLVTCLSRCPLQRYHGKTGRAPHPSSGTEGGWRGARGVSRKGRESRLP